jgi:hypothetical protein
MKKVIFAICALVMATSCIYSVNLNLGKRIVCKGEVEIHEMELGSFSHVVLNGAADMKIGQKEACIVKVEANEEVFDYLDFRVEDDVLILETKKDGKTVQLAAQTFCIYVDAPVLESVTVNGSADAAMEDYTSDKDFSLAINGAGDLELEDIKVPTLSFAINGAGDLEAKDLDVKTLNVSINGAGDVEVSGKAENASLRVSGAGDIDARDLECPNIEKSKSGAASIRIRNK